MALMFIISSLDPSIKTYTDIIYRAWPAPVTNETTPWYAGGALFNTMSYLNQWFNELGAKLGAFSNLVNTVVNPQSVVMFGKSQSVQGVSMFYVGLLIVLGTGIALAARGSQ